jgi:hypothetical protein
MPRFLSGTALKLHMTHSNTRIFVTQEFTQEKCRKTLKNAKNGIKKG